MILAELNRKLNELMALPAEVEWVEFKEAKNSFKFDDLGKYFSALSNEANLKDQKYGWLILGVTDQPPRRIVGSQYCPNRTVLDRLKQGIAEKAGNGLTFVEIHELLLPEGRVLMFQIPPAIQGIPTAWDGHYYGRNGESLGPLNLSEIDRIRGQAVREDWSAKICREATLNDLDPDAIRFAREQYKEKHPRQREEVDQWDDLTFLNKGKVCIGGQITNTAIILLGREEAEHFISPAYGWITWVLKDEDGIARDYEHFRPPLILAVSRVFAKIRNLTYRYMPNDTLFPAEITQYDPWVMRELLHNCIAHQDYTLAGRISVVEEQESLLFTNLGYFIPGSVEEVIRSNAPPPQYRNPFLANAMVNLNMIDTIGSGIRRIFEKQRQRFFPLPDYDLSEQPERVEVRLFGKVLDENYTRLLVKGTNLDLMDVIALDKVQKKRPLTEEEFKSLKERKLVEGRRPNLYVSAKIAAVTDDKATYIKHRAFDKAHYKALVISFLKEFHKAKREEIDNLLLNKLSDALTEKQKRNRITNLLSEMSYKDKTIITSGPKRTAEWRLRDNEE
ncbi:MAG: RNA-binding domain-containing protein [bacterium]